MKNVRREQLDVGGQDGMESNSSTAGGETGEAVCVALGKGGLLERAERGGGDGRRLGRCSGSGAQGAEEEASAGLDVCHASPQASAPTSEGRYYSRQQPLSPQTRFLPASSSMASSQHTRKRRKKEL